MSRIGWLVVVSLVGLTGGCNGDKDTETGDTDANPDTDTDTDTQTTVDNPFFSNESSEITAVPEVVRATFTTEEAVDARVEFGWDGDCARQTAPMTNGTSHEVLLAGIPSNLTGAATTACWTAVATDSMGVEQRSAPMEIAIPAPPQGTQFPTVTKDVPEKYDSPYILVATILPPAHFVIDRQGNPVWAELLDDSRQTVNITQVPSMDGFSYSDYNSDHSIDDSHVRFVDYAGEITSSVQLPNGHHIYHLEADGAITYLGIDVRDVPGWGPVVGDTIMRIAPDGTVTELWNGWYLYDMMPIIDEDGNGKSDDDNGFYPQGVDWTHANYFEYNAERDTYLISFRNINMVMEVAATPDAAGVHEIKRSFGHYGTYTIEGKDADFIYHPHNAVYLENGNIIVMTMGRNGTASHVTELAVDDATRTATIVADFTSGGDGVTGVDAKVQGAGERQPNGNTLINWGAGGLLQEVTATGEIVWEAEFKTAAFAGHAHAMDAFYPE